MAVYVVRVPRNQCDPMTGDGRTIQVKAALSAITMSGALVFRAGAIGRDEGDLVEAFAPGQWEHVELLE